MKFTTMAILGSVAAVAAAIAARKALSVGSDVVETVKTAVNPFDANNLANTGFMNLYQYTTGSTQSLGEDVYDVVHPNQGDPAAMQFGLDKMYELPPVL